MIPKFTMREALGDPNLLANGVKGPSWKVWRTLLIASRGEPLDVDERKALRKLAKRKAPTKPVDELWVIAGRRGGKSRSMATLASYLGGLCDYSDVLVPGEQGVLLCVAPDQRQAGIILGYAEATFLGSPLLKCLVKNRTTDTLELTNRISIEVRAASFRRLRGPTYIACLVDESAFFYSDESSNPDTEILAAIRPGLGTTGGPLIVASSPYARRGILFDAYRNFHGKDEEGVLVVKGGTRDFNPNFSLAVINRELNRDPARAKAEYLGEFRSDIEAFLSREAVEAVVDVGRRETAPADGVRYHAFVDPSGGSGDAFTLGIGHRNGQSCVIDCVRETRPPFSPESVVHEFAQVLKSYRVMQVKGDHYAGMWPREQFAKRGIEYLAHVKPKSELYLSLLAAINSQTVELLDNNRLTAQLISLERRTSRGGRDSIDHPPGAHDDLANVVAGVTHEVLHSPSNRMLTSFFAPIVVSP